MFICTTCTRFSCLLGTPVLDFHVYWYTLYQIPMFIGTPCTRFPCIMVHPVIRLPCLLGHLVINSQVYWDTLYQIPMFMGTPFTRFPCLLGHLLLDSHVYWGTLYQIPMFIDTPFTRYGTCGDGLMCSNCNRCQVRSIKKTKILGKNMFLAISLLNITWFQLGKFSKKKCISFVVQGCSYQTFSCWSDINCLSW